MTVVVNVGETDLVLSSANIKQKLGVLFVNHKFNGLLEQKIKKDHQVLPFLTFLCVLFVTFSGLFCDLHLGDQNGHEWKKLAVFSTISRGDHVSSREEGVEGDEIVRFRRFDLWANFHLKK